MDRAAAKVTGREHQARQLRFTVPGWNQQHQAWAAALLHILAEPLQAAADILMNPARDVARVDLLDEGQQPATRQHPVCQLQPGRLYRVGR